MHADVPLTEIALIIVCALVCGLIFTRFKQPAILGYMLAGLVIGPYMVVDSGMEYVIKSLSELGVFMLLFVLGMEMNLRFFRENWRTTLGCVLTQFALSLGAMYAISFFFDWSLGLTFVLGCIITLSSTAVAIKMLDSMGKLKTDTGHLTIGILIAQDLAFVPMVLATQGFGGESFEIGIVIAKVLGSAGVLTLLVWTLSNTERLHIPYLNEISKDGELLPLLGLTFCFGLAAITGMVGLSAAYGAFLAGLILGNTAERHQVLEVTHPIQSLLLMVFFLSVGLLVDVDFLMDNIVKISILLFIVFFGKTVLNTAILHAFKQPWRISFISSLVLAQLGEFAFVLSDMARSQNLLKPDEQRLVISLTVLSLAASPFWLTLAKKFQGEDGSFSFKSAKERGYGLFRRRIP
ncbi:MAG: cation:proton antiporter [Alphaproteobacteria bacterium]